MQDGQDPDSHEEEDKGSNISAGIENTKSNGHKERIEPLELIETMRSLKIEMQSCRANNERILKAQEKQNQLNTQLVQSLNQLQRKKLEWKVAGTRALSLSGQCDCQMRKASKIVSIWKKDYRMIYENTS